MNTPRLSQWASAIQTASFSSSQLLIPEHVTSAHVNQRTSSNAGGGARERRTRLLRISISWIGEHPQWGKYLSVVAYKDAEWLENYLDTNEGESLKFNLNCAGIWTHDVARRTGRRRKKRSNSCTYLGVWNIRTTRWHSQSGNLFWALI